MESLCRVGHGKGTRRKLWRVYRCASIYFLWQERYRRLHGASFRTASTILQLIISTVWAYALSWSEDVLEFL